MRARPCGRLSWSSVHRHCAVALAILGGWQLPKYVGARAQYLGATEVEKGTARE